MDDGVSIWWLLYVFIIFIVVVGWLGYQVVYAITYSEAIITIQEKWVDVSSSHGKYLLSSIPTNLRPDGEVFTIEDSLLNGRFDSSNMYARLQPGMTCHIKLNGWRFPFLSDYRNILIAECQG